VLAAIKVNTDELKPYEDAAVATSLLRNEVKPGTILSRESNAKLGTKHLFCLMVPR
jgi:zinc protease